MVRQLLFAAAVAAAGFGMPALAADCPGAAATLAAVATAWSRTETPGNVELTPSTPLRLTLGPAAKAGFDVRPRPDARAGQAGSFDFRATSAGEWIVVVGQRMWVDVIDASGRALEPVRIERDLRCDGIAKSLVFALVTGSYRLQLSEGASSSTRVLVAPLH